MKPRIVAVVDNVHMGLGHEGLRGLAKLHRLPIEGLAQGELLLFLNRAKDKIKMVGHGGQVIAYFKMPHGRRLPLEAIQYIPQTFTADGKVDLDAAIEKHVTSALSRRAGPDSPLTIARAMKRAGIA